MRGYKMSGIEEGEGDSKFKIFWLGVVEGVTWGFSKSLSDSDSRASYSTGSRMSSSVSEYYAQSSLYSSAINLTDYSKIKFTVNSGWSQTADGRKVGVMINNALNSYTRQQTGVGGGNIYTLDISSLRGFYFVGVYTSSQNRNGSGISVSRVWLEQ